MPSHQTGGSQRNAAPLLATFFTFLYALVPCLLLVVAGSSQSRNPYADWLVILAAFLALTLLVYFVRRLLPESVRDVGYLILRKRRDDALADYKPRRKARRQTRFGTQKPTTVEDIRKIREQVSATTWVRRSDKGSE